MEVLRRTFWAGGAIIFSASVRRTLSTSKSQVGLRRQRECCVWPAKSHHSLLAVARAVCSRQGYHA